MRERSQSGYTLVVLVVAITVMNILVAVALPMWSKQIQREKEEEAIFRGLQYAEAIRVFQKRFGRYPNALDELMEVEPRSIRKLWTDPLSEHGRFGVMVIAPRAPARTGPAAGRGAGAPGPGAGSPGVGEANGPGGGVQPGRTPGAGPGAGRAPGAAPGGAPVKMRRVDDEGKEVAVKGLPIHGVYIDDDGDGVRMFNGRTQYSDWVFMPELIPVPQVRPDGLVVGARSDWIGKPFPESLAGTPRDGSAPGRPGGGRELGGGSPPSSLQRGPNSPTGGPSGTDRGTGFGGRRQDRP